MKRFLKKNPAASIILSLLLSGCANVTDVRQAADQKKIYGIDCSGRHLSINACYKKAARLCPQGYTVIANRAKSGYENIPMFPFALMRVAAQAGETSSEAVWPGGHKGITVKCN